MLGGFIKWITAWTLIIALLVASSHLEPGQKLLSYLAWLLVVLIIVTHYKDIGDFFSKNILTEGQT